jgi:hypothetical protein
MQLERVAPESFVAERVASKDLAAEIEEVAMILLDDRIKRSGRRRGGIRPLCSYQRESHHEREGKNENGGSELCAHADWSAAGV